MALDVAKVREALEQPRGQQPAGCDLVSIERSTLRGLLVLCEQAGAALEGLYGVADQSKCAKKRADCPVCVAESALAALRAAGIGTGGGK